MKPRASEALGETGHNGFGLVLGKLQPEGDPALPAGDLFRGREAVWVYAVAMASSGREAFVLRQEQPIDETLLEFRCSDQREQAFIHWAASISFRSESQR